MPRFVLIRSADDIALAAPVAAALGRPLDLLSVPDAGVHSGALWWLGLVEAAAAGRSGGVGTALLDCGDSAGRTLGALRAGVGDVLFDGADDIAGRLGEIAASAGGRLWRARPDCLDLDRERQPAAACRAWLTVDADRPR